MAYDWFEWNGTRCTEYGIYVAEQPSPTIPSERVTFTSVPGRPGSLTTVEGNDIFDDLTLTAECFVRDLSRLNDIAAWLKGAGKVTFANRQGGFYYARIVNQIPFEKILRGNPHRSFAVNFRCKPFWYINGAEDIILTESGQFITNPGSVYSEPVITIEGGGEITLIIGTTIVELEGVTENIIIDSELQETYSGNSLMNECMTGDFPILKPGVNAVSWNGDVARMTVKGNWRFL